MDYLLLISGIKIQLFPEYQAFHEIQLLLIPEKRYQSYLMVNETFVPKTIVFKESICYNK